MGDGLPAAPPPRDALVLCASCHPQGRVSRHPEFGERFSGVSHRARSLSLSSAVSEAGPRESTHPPANVGGETFLAPPLPPDFSLLGIISKSLRFFFFKERESKELIDVM